MYEYYCTACKKDFKQEQFTQGILHCPFCGIRYNITVLGHNNTKRDRVSYVSKYILLITWLGGAFTFAIPVIYLLVNKTPNTNLVPALMSIGLIVWMILLWIGGLVLKSRAKKLFPD